LAARVGEDGTVISVKQWLSLVDPASEPGEPIVFALDVSPDRSSAAVCAAGVRDDGLCHVEVAQHKRGTGWLLIGWSNASRCISPAAVLFAQNSPAAAMEATLENAGVG
jgi:hypothetical protein